MGRTVSVVALLVAFVALGWSGWLLRHPDSPASADYASEQIAQARTTACAAHDVVSAGVFENTNRPKPAAAEDVAGGMVVVANAKIALFDGGQYLIARTGPATPPELATEMKRFGEALMDIGAAANAGVLDADPEQTARFKDADAVNSRIKGLCG